MEQDDGLKQPTRRDWVGYWSMIVQQTQNAFNDKAAQFLLIPLGGWLLGEASRVEHVAGLLIVLPFILFAPVVGWLSDRFSKRNVMLGAAIAQLLILCLLSCALWLRSLNLALVGFFLLALQSAVFSPAKMGIVKELVGSARLGFASGMQQMTSLIAILIGQVSMGYLFDARLEAGGDGWNSALVPLLVIAVCAVPAIGLAWIVPKTPAHGAGRLQAKLLWSHVGQMVELWQSPVLRRTALGIAFFWGFGGFINLWSIGVAKDMTGGGPGFGVLSSNLMLAASLGMAGGFGVASLLCRRRIELGWVPIAGGMMTLLVLVLATLDPRTAVFYFVLGSAAFAAAVFLVPLNAYLQDQVSPSRRGSIIAAVNLQDCIAGLLAVLLQGGFTWAYQALDKPVWLGFRGQLVFAGLMCGLVTWRVVRRLPSDMIRVIGVPFLRWWYRLRAVGAERVPETGGVLLLVNHVTFADAFVVTALCPRPVRFVMAAGFERNRWVRWFTRLFNTVPIEADRPRQAIRLTVEALKAGDVVCMFPEGQISRTGLVNELQRGSGLMARMSGQPVVPLYIDGMWGSYFSFSDGGAFRGRLRRPRFPVIGTFGEPMDGDEVGAESIRAGLLAAAAGCLDERLLPEGWERRPIDGVGPEGPGLRRVWANGFQIGRTGMLAPGLRMQAWSDDPDAKGLSGLVDACPKLFGLKFEWLAPDQMPAAGVPVVGGKLARERVGSGVENVSLFDFSGEEAGGCDGVYPCLSIEGIVVAVSMPDPELPPDSKLRQEGSRAGCCGKLLPGFVPRERGGRIVLEGASCPPEGIELPEGCSIDEGLFVRVGG